MTGDELLEPVGDETKLSLLGHAVVALLAASIAYGLMTVVPLFREVEGPRLVLSLLFATTIGALAGYLLKQIFLDIEDPLFTNATETSADAENQSTDDSTER